MLTTNPHQEVLRLQRQLGAAQRISQALFEHHALEKIIETAMDVALEVSDTEAGCVLLANPESEQLVFHYSTGHRVPNGTSMPWTKGIAGAVFQTGSPEVIHEVQRDPRHFPGIGALDGFVTRDLIALPLKKWEGNPIGVLEVLNKRSGRLDQEDLLILTVISSFTALAIEQSRLTKEAKLAEIARLVGEISHDVNNMLTPVVLCAPDIERALKELHGRFSEADLSRTKAAHDECTGFFEMLRHSVRRIQERAKLMADCVKGNIAPPHFQACRIEEVVRGVVEALRVVAQQQEIALRAEGLADLPGLWADEMRLYNAFYNLINNAIPEVPCGGSITITGKLEPGNDFIQVVIADTGRGMPPDVRDSLFSGKAISRKRGGTGLGTKIVKDVIDVHGGKITVESQENKGTTFHLRLPLRPRGESSELAFGLVQEFDVGGNPLGRVHMSGFAALHYLDGRLIVRASVDKMTTTLAHRGMDGSGLWQDGQIGLGHCMRWTTPESLKENLPLFDPLRKLAITADARLDNRDELLSALDVSDHTVPDSTLILLSYDRWGTACPEKLLGDFAFVIWDMRTRMLFCARDHIGVKPFVYYHKPGRLFACASEIKALLCLPEVPQHLNESRVGDCLALLFENKETTFYHDILRLPPAHRLTVGTNGAQLEAYWSLDPHHSLAKLSNEEYSEQFGSLFQDAVRARMRSAFAVGSTLSGGLDSSSVTCTARDIGTSQGHVPLHTFSLFFEDVPSCDERRYIKTVVEQGGITSHLICGDKISPLRDFEETLAGEDEPYLIPNLFLFRALHEAAAANKVRVLLDGVDGDIAMCHGEAYLTDLVRAGRLISVSRELLGIARHGRMPWQRACRSYVVSPLIPDGLRQIYRRLRRQRPAENFDAVMRSLVQPGFARRIHLQERIRQAESSRKRPKNIRQVHSGRLNHGWVALALEAIDRASQRLGVEARHPFFDKRLLEFSLALPPDQKLSKGWTRVALRRAMEGILPPAIQWRIDKADLAPNFNHSLIAHDRERVEKGIRFCAPVLEEYLDMGKLRQVYERNLIKPNKIDTSAVWYPLTIGLWLSRKRAFHEKSAIP